jgi:hypothetical protein
MLENVYNAHGVSCWHQQPRARRARRNELAQSRRIAMVPRRLVPATSPGSWHAPKAAARAAGKTRNKICILLEHQTCRLSRAAPLRRSC